MIERLPANNLNLIRKVHFTPELIESLKHFAHLEYDTIYHDLYVADFPSGQLADGVDDFIATFQHQWRSHVTEPLLVGYAFAQPDADLDSLRAALREVGSVFGQLMGGTELDDYDDLAELAHYAFDQLFVHVQGEPA